MGIIDIISLPFKEELVATTFILLVASVSSVKIKDTDAFCS